MKKNQVIILSKKKFCVLFGQHFIIIAIFTVSLLITDYALSEVRRCKGQTLYVPIYSHIYHGNREDYPFDLTATLSIRNTDFDYPINITLADYYDSHGKLIKSYLQKPLKIDSMASTHFFIAEYDKTGGSGANFIVKWEAKNKVTEPLIESVMIGTKIQQGISFTSRGQVIKESECVSDK